MGLLAFVKEAGQALLGGAKAAPTAGPVPPDPEKVRDYQERRLAAAIAQHVETLGLGVEDLGVAVDGHTATVTGRAATQADKEKVLLAVGNVQGIGEVDDRMTVDAPAEAEATFHTVVRGDTLSKIAQHHYGKAGAYMKIFEANKPLLSDPDKIYPGQVLRIPAA